MPGPTREDVDRALASFDWEAWRRQLEEQYGAWYRETLEDAATAAATSYHATWHADDPFVRRFASKYIGERITQISETTREKVAAVIRLNLEAADEGLTVTELGSVIAELFKEFSRDRAQSIARNETAMAVNHGRLMGYAAAGFEFVEVSDGCDFDEPCTRADGQIWSIAYAMAHALEHPNCERSFSPIPREDLPANFVPDDPED